MIKCPRVKEKNEKFMENMRIELTKLENSGSIRWGAMLRDIEMFLENKDEYRLFLEDDMDFDKYNLNMRRDGIWAG